MKFDQRLRSVNSVERFFVYLCQLTHFSRFFIDRKIRYFNSYYRDHEVDDTVTYEKSKRLSFLIYSVFFLILENFHFIISRLILNSIVRNENYKIKR